MTQMNCQVHMIFKPDAAGYASMVGKSSRRAELLLEFMDELLLMRGDKSDFKGRFADVAIDTVDGRFVVDSLDEVLRPLVIEYNALWRAWKIQHKGEKPEKVGNIQMVSAANETDIYYYADLETGESWCRRGFNLELVQPSGGVVPFRIERDIDEKDPITKKFHSDVKLTLTHVPIQP
ncbi:MAG: hypothetical protein ACI8TQ_002026 [Planctomycetota bacterium]|jgi:hypothetical protein